MNVDMRGYEKWCNERDKADNMRRDSSPRREVYKVGFIAGQEATQTVIDDLRFELLAKKVELATLLLLLTQGKQLMNELAQASDGAVLAGEPFPDGLNDRVRNWCHANWATPIADALPKNKRYVEGQMMTWGGLPVWVDGIAVGSPENWPLIDANDMTPKCGNQPMRPNKHYPER